MLRAFIEWLYELFAPPCPHQWEKLAELRDREERPTAASIVRMCKHCGAVNEVKFVAPEGRGCPPHKWDTTSTAKIWKEEDATKEKRENTIPIGEAYIQTCAVCGDVRRIDLK